MKLSKFAVQLVASKLQKKYDETPEDVFKRAAYAFADNPEHGARMYSYIKNKWFCPSTPILANAPKRISFGESFYDNFNKKHFLPESLSRAMPISCFLSYVPDTVVGLIEHSSEVRFLCIIGGGVAGHWSDIRANVDNGKSPGPIPFIKTVDSDVLAYHQSGTRRGSYAAYLDVNHPSIEEFLVGRTPTGGDINRKFINIHHGINITREFLECVRLNKEFNLVCPHTNNVVKTINARTLWLRILETRHKTGEPYLINIDVINDLLNPHLKKRGYKVRGSNLCSEITLPTDEENTAVCCLSSLNVEYFDEWSNDSFIIEDCIRYLDNVLEYFITYGENYPYLKKAINSARGERSVGLGTMGLHNFFQKKHIPFDSLVAMSYNNKIYKHIFEKSIRATRILAKERGEPERIAGSGHRNAHLIAIAPNANTSIFLATSPSVEPLRANFYYHKISNGINLIKNRYLVSYLKDKLGFTTTKLNKLIKESIARKGSIQFSDEIDNEAKKVFKTAVEIDQNIIVFMAKNRQDYVDQAQSINLFFPACVPISYLNEVHWNAMYKLKLKTLYYLRSEAVERAQINYENGNGCTFCAD